MLSDFLILGVFVVLLFIDTYFFFKFRKAKKIKGKFKYLEFFYGLLFVLAILGIILMILSILGV